MRALGILGLFFLVNPFSSVVATGAMQMIEDAEIDQILERYERIIMNPVDVEREVTATGRLVIPTPSGVFEILLEPHDVRGADYLAEETVDGGARRILPPMEINTFRGISPGLHGSEARFSIRRDSFEGVILTHDEWYFFEPMRNFTPSAHPSELVVYRKSDIRPNVFGTCGTTLSHRIGEAHDHLEPIVMEAGADYVADVATDGDYEYVTAEGGSAGANSTILDIINQVDGVYTVEINVSLQVIYQHTWDTEEDPYSSTSPSTILSEFRSHWNANFYSVPFDLAHMWTGKNMDGSTIGIAYVGVVCNARSFSYGVSQRFGSSPGKYILTAHEIGHNFSASHVGAPDCGNTIMNASIGSNFSFCQDSRDEISGHATGHSSCLTSGPTAPSNLTALVVSGSQINLSWQDNSSDETHFGIEKKVGPMGAWLPIDTTPENTTSYSDTGLDAGLTYYYRVQAFDGSTGSAYSNEASATTESDPPNITGVLPSSGGIGTQVTLTGANFNGATEVSFNYTDAGFTVHSSAEIHAEVPAGATTGRIRVTTPSGTAVSSSNFVVNSCSYALNPEIQTFNVNGGSDYVGITTTGGCGWTATSNAAWIVVTSGSAGSGSGTVQYTLYANGSGARRTGTMTVAGQTFTVIQGGSICDINVDGTANVLDIQLLIITILGRGGSLEDCDINNDGNVNVLDLQTLGNVVLGIGSCP